MLRHNNGYHPPASSYTQSGLAMPTVPVFTDNIDIERIQQNQVKYLVFEGGGGKGIVFLGAIKALEERGVLQYSGHRLKQNGQIDGIAGSSAGALTAVLLSCGYRSSFLEQLMFDGYDFNLFFDQPSSTARIPSPTGCRSAGHRKKLTDIFGWIKGLSLNEIAEWAAGAGKASDELKDKFLGRRLLPYLFNLFFHYGVFSGCAAHDLFNGLIARQAARITGQSDWRQFLNMNFETHHRIFQTQLVLTGSNFSTGKTTFFSALNSPRFPVAAAARISMGIPLIMKPMTIPVELARQYVVRSSNPNNLEEKELTGVWVDGGYFNNLPRNAFAHIPNGLRHTLSFSLSAYREGPSKITNLLEFLSAYVKFGLFGSGESQNSRTTGTLEDTVTLVAGNDDIEIGLTDFTFNETEKKICQRFD